MICTGRGRAPVVLGSATLRAKSANMEPRSDTRTSSGQSTPYIIPIHRWDAPRTVCGTPDGQNVVMLKIQPLQDRSSPPSLPRRLLSKVWWVEVITPRPIRHSPVLPTDNMPPLGHWRAQIHSTIPEHPRLCFSRVSCQF